MQARAAVRVEATIKVLSTTARTPLMTTRGAERAGPPSELHSTFLGGGWNP